MATGRPARGKQVLKLGKLPNSLSIIPRVLLFPVRSRFPARPRFASRKNGGKEGKNLCAAELTDPGSCAKLELQKKKERKYGLNYFINTCKVGDCYHLDRGPPAFMG